MNKESIDLYREIDTTSNNNIQEKVYLDFNATTPLDVQVIEAINESLINNWQNPSSQYKKGKQAKEKIDEARQSISTMINSLSPSDIIFLSGGTEANNLVFYSVLNRYEEYRRIAHKNNLEPKKLPHIIISNIEHDSVALIAANLQKNNLAEISSISVNEHGFVDVNDTLEAIRENTILISVMLANNETGVIQPVKEIGARLNKMRASNNTQNEHFKCPLYLHTDAAQAIGKIEVDVQSLNVDFLTIVGHKFYGPKIGALYARNCLKPEFDSQFISELNIDTRKTPVVHMFQGASQENGLRPGTENTPMIVGLGKAAELVSKNLKQYEKHMRNMRDYLENSLMEIFGKENIAINGRSSKSERLPNTCNVSFIADSRFKGYIILQNTTVLEASTGACCHSGELKPSKILLAMKIDKNIAANAIRLSVGRETTKKQIDTVVEDIKNALEIITSSQRTVI